MSKSEGNVLGFFGELNPFSNFHYAPFVINGQKYHSSEQYIQHQKCVLFGDHSTEQLVLTAATPFDCKTLYKKNISNFDAAMWKINAKASCTPGILTKFEQHEVLGSLLHSTGTKTLNECCKDKDWGTGVPLHDANALKSEHWHSQGLLGEILETVRNLIQIPSVNNVTQMVVTESPSPAIT